MSNLTVTSSRSAMPRTIDEMLQDPTEIPQRVINSLEGLFLENLFFRDGGANQGAVVYSEAESMLLDEVADVVAEFAEIPGVYSSEGPKKTAYTVKTGYALKVSREMRNYNQVSMLTKQIKQLGNTMVFGSANASIKALSNSGVQTVQASGGTWGSDGANPIKDLTDAMRKVSSANTSDNKLGTLGYKPDTLLLNDADATLLAYGDETIKRLYVGDIAHENPAYKGMKDFTVCGLNVATSQWIPSGTAYVFEAGTPGFVSYSDVLQMTPFYSPGGNDATGGPTQSWRSDCFMSRAIGVDNPLAVCKITGITG